jgi:regulatory protein
VTERRSAYLDALHMVARRELSVAECRVRLARHAHSEQEIEAALARLIEAGVLDDRRVAGAFVRTAANLKNRGRLRIQRELQTKGIDRDVADEALAEALAGADEGAMVARAIEKRLRGRTLGPDRAASARLFHHLVRQGYTPSVVVAELRKLRDN